MDFWAIVGDHDTRKSSAVRALTGAGRRQPAWSIRLRTGIDILAFVEVRSLQEGPTAVSPVDFVRRVNRMTGGLGTTHVLVPLRYGRFNGQPDALSYVDHFVNGAGWRCLGIVLTGVNRSTTRFASYPSQVFSVAMPRSPFDAPNAIAGQMRSRWRIV